MARFRFIHPQYSLLFIKVSLHHSFKPQYNLPLSIRHHHLITAPYITPIATSFRRYGIVLRMARVGVASSIGVSQGRHGFGYLTGKSFPSTGEA